MTKMIMMTLIRVMMIMSDQDDDGFDEEISVNKDDYDDGPIDDNDHEDQDSEDCVDESSDDNDDHRMMIITM